jgi:hypothetical protein
MVFQGGNMGVATVGSSMLTPSSDSTNYKLRKQESGPQLPKSDYALSARLMTESYSVSSMSLEYTSKDGDKVSLSMQSVDYSKSIMEVAASGSEEDLKKLIDYIKKEYEQMKLSLLNGSAKETGNKVSDKPKVEKTDPLQVPEEWSADNTSQRIVDFATAFLSIFEGTGEDFLSTIKAAIEEGFKQARDILGELPDEVNSLIDDTYAKTMSKLDDWARGQGIEIPAAEEVTA